MKNVAKIRHLELMDYLRGLAIIAVLLTHSFANVFGSDTLPWNGWFRSFSVPASYLCLSPFGLGSAGVAIFFVVSGFCIHLSFHQQGRKWGSFFTKRIFRIYPAYLAAIALTLLLAMEYSRLGYDGRQIVTQYAFRPPQLGGPLSLELFSHLFLFHNIQSHTFASIVGAFWSLAIEAQLYLLYPVLLLGVARLGWGRMLLVLAAVEILIRGFDGVVQTAGWSDALAGQISGIFSRSPFGFWFSWALGARVADAFLKNEPMPFRKSSPLWWLALAVVSYFIRPLYSFWFLFFAMATAVLTSRFLDEGTRTKIPLPSWSLSALGKIGLWSYSIYLFHQPLLNIFCQAIVPSLPAEFHNAPVGFALFVASWAIIIPFGFLSYRLIELPGIALGNRLIGKQSNPLAAPKPPVSTMRYVIYAGLFLILVSGFFQVSAKFKQADPQESTNLAWILATSPDPGDRNGILAVKLAEDACNQTQHQDAVMVGTLAAAYAEAGRFDDAVATVRIAGDLAKARGQAELAQKCQELLALYQQHQPYRDGQGNASAPSVQ